MTRRYVALLALPPVLLPGLTQSYPLDGYPDTGIRRLEYSQ